MLIPIRLIIAGGTAVDAERLAAELRQVGYLPTVAHAPTAAALTAALERQGWQAVVLPDGGTALLRAADVLALIRDHGNDVPLIVVAELDSLSGDRVAAAMPAGRHHYVTRDRLVQLLPALTNYVPVPAASRQRDPAGATALEAAFGDVQALIDALPVGVLVASAAGTVLYCNAAGRRMVAPTAAGGMLRQEGSVGANLGKLVLRDSVTGRPLAPRETGLMRALAGEYVQRCEYTTEGGGVVGIRWLLASAAPLHDAAGAIVGAVTIFSDITRERELLRDLAASEARLRTVYESIACGVIVYGADGAVLHVNRQAEALFGRNLAALRALGPFARDLELYHEDGRRVAFAERPVVAAQQTGVERREVTLRVVRPDGSARWLQIDVVPVRDAAGAVTQYVTSAIDVGMRRQAEAALQASEQLYRGLFENANDVVYTRDLLGRFTSINEAGLRLTGYSREEFLALTTTDLVLPQYHDRIRAAAEQHLAGEQTEAFEVEISARDGRHLMLEISTQLIERDGYPAAVQGIARDITARKQADAALRASEARFRALSEHSSDLIAILEPDGVLRWLSGSAERVTGYPAGVLTGRGLERVIHPDDLSAVEAALAALARTPGGATTLEFRLRHADQSWRSVEAVASNLLDDPSVRGIVANCRDVTERRQAQAALAHQALHDALTGLPNRTLLHDRLQQAVRNAQRQEQPLALLFLDLDRFKDVNDSFGHHVGDLLLQQVGRRLHDALRGSDTVARLGGDEFAIVLPAVDAAGAAITAQKIVSAFGRPFPIAVDVEQHVLDIGASIGLALFPQHGADAGALMRHADVAMYAAKRSGGGFVSYEPDRAPSGSRQFVAAGELRQALAQGQLVLLYQPIVRSRDRRLLRREALVRWRHPRRGLLLPDDVVAPAEQSGLAYPLARHVLDLALQQCRTWRRTDETAGVAVNLSPRALLDPQMVAAVNDLLAATGVPPAALTLEVTEAALAADPLRAQDVLARLDAIGVRLALDAFGTGYSSLTALKRLPLDEIKIDRSFVQGMAQGDLAATDTAIIRSTVALAHSLGLAVVGVGVEDEATLQQLAGLGCELVQGFYLGRPAPA